MEETLIDVTELFDIKIMNQVYAQACIQAGAAEPGGLDPPPPRI